MSLFTFQSPLKEFFFICSFIGDVPVEPDFDADDDVSIFRHCFDTLYKLVFKSLGIGLFSIKLVSSQVGS